MTAALEVHERTARHMFSRLLDSTPTAGSSARTITDAGVLEERAPATGARRYASEDGEYRDGVRAVAAPVRDPAGEAIAALVARGDTAGPPIP